MKSLPLISVIIPTFNEEKLLARCLKSITSQKYPRNKIEILIIDDESTDNTVAIAKDFRAKVITSGNKNIEISKSLGMAKAKGELLMFVDADNEILSDTWFRDAVDLFDKDKDIVGVQSYRYAYYKDDPAANRYCSLMGINDPMAFYLGKRGQMMHTEESWMYPSSLIDESEKFIVCNFTTDTIQTIGSQGYMVRTSLMKKTHWKPYLFHLDSAYEIVAKGHGKFAFIKEDVRHDYVSSVTDMIRKLRRNITLYLELQDKRHYRYDISSQKVLLVTLMMLTGIIPLIDSLKGFVKKSDVAWFLHPMMSVIVIFLYSYSVLESKLRGIIPSGQ